MSSRIRRWISDRWPLDPLIRLSLEEEMPGGARFAYVFGSSLIITFLLQATTGIIQLFYFVPSTDHAYNSLNYLRAKVPFGWLIHNLHYWGASAMVLLVGLHMCRIFIWGAYKHPRELTWLIGVGLLMVTQSLMFTGPVLVWDIRGYWEAEVGTSIAGTVPVIGDLVKRILRGGATMGQLTLSRFFILHVAILPILLVVLIGIHIIALRHFGIVGPWNEAKRKPIGQFWPDQVFKDALFFILVFLVLISLSVYASPSIDGPADPLDTSYIPKPEWNFLFLYEALKFFHGRLEPVGTVGIPLFLILLLISPPFLDRNPERSPARRPLAMIGGLILVLSVITLAISGYYSEPGNAKTPSSSATSTPPPSVGVSVAQLGEGAQLFRSQGCIGCHRADGTGGTAGPELSPKTLRGRSREWLIIQIRNPKAHNPNTIMPDYIWPSEQQVNAVLNYLLSLAAGVPSPAVSPVTIPAPPAAEVRPASTKPVRFPEGPPGQAANIIGSTDRGVVWYTQVCLFCHGPLGSGNIPNPGAEDETVPSLNPINRNLLSQDPQTFVENIDRFIQHGSTPKGPNPKFTMPAFGGTHALSQQAISNIEAYILQLNGVNRAQPIHPSPQARSSLLVALVAFGMTGLGLRVLWGQKSKLMRRST